MTVLTSSKYPSKLNILIISMFHRVPGVPCAKMERFAAKSKPIPINDFAKIAARQAHDFALHPLQHIAT